MVVNATIHDDFLSGSNMPLNSKARLNRLALFEQPQLFIAVVLNATVPYILITLPWNNAYLI